jgi:hypothetical protein
VSRQTLPLTPGVPPPAAVIDAVDNGLGQSGDVVATFNKLTHLIDDTCGGTLGEYSHWSSFSGVGHC